MGRKGVQKANRRPSLRSVEERNELVTQWIKLAWKLGRVARSRSRTLQLFEEEVAADMAVDALIRAAELWDPSRGMAFPSYLHQWVLLSLRSRARQRLKEEMRIPVTPGAVPDDVPSSQERPPAELAEDSDWAEGLLAVLTPPQREALRLLYWDGVSSVEAGRRLGITKSAVLFRRDRALAVLRRLSG